MTQRPAASRPSKGALRAFLDTDLDLYIEGGEGWKNYAQLGAQVANTPEWGAELMDEHFDPVVLRLIGLLKQGAARLRRRGHLLGLSLRHRRADADAGADRAASTSLSGGLCKSDDFAAVKERMASFMAAGFLSICKPPGAG